VSGLANGVDTAAHKSTVEASGRTVAVLPGDINEIYPASNKKLSENMANKGALLSEVSDKINIHRSRFIQRNRITSGLCEKVIIWASGESGGTIHQAKYAKQQAKPILLYDPDLSDGQSPEKIKNMWAHTFTSMDEMRELVRRDVSEFNTPNYESKTIDDLN